MKVEDLMTRFVESCRPETNLAEAAMMMWNHDCGIIPVTGENNKLVGVITDRDVCMATAIQYRKASEIAVNEVISGECHTCLPDDDAKDALEIMSRYKVRRLPVIDRNNRLQGVISINDLVLEAKPDKPKRRTAASTSRVAPLSSLSYEDVMSAFKSICEHRMTSVTAVSA